MNIIALLTYSLVDISRSEQIMEVLPQRRGFFSRTRDYEALLLQLAYSRSGGSRVSVRLGHVQNPPEVSLRRSPAPTE